MRRDRWRIIFLTLDCAGHRKRKIECLDLLEAHRFFLTNGDEVDTTVLATTDVVSKS